MLILKVFCLILMSCNILPGDNSRTMLEDNFFNGGYLIINPKGTDWRNWNSIDYMVFLDSAGNSYPFFPPFLSDKKGGDAAPAQNKAKGWFSTLNPDSASRIDGQMLPLSKEDQEKATKKDRKLLKAADRLKKTEQVQNEGIKDNRVRDIQEVVPE
ncbi:hypothetical protein ACFL5V_09260 [Fibrobacterota bacterium]